MDTKKISGKLILTLQVSGFFTCLLGLLYHAPVSVIAVSFAVHFAGDVLFLIKEGLP